MFPQTHFWGYEKEVRFTHFVGLQSYTFFCFLFPTYLFQPISKVVRVVFLESIFVLFLVYLFCRLLYIHTCLIMIHIGYYFDQYISIRFWKINMRNFKIIRSAVCCEWNAYRTHTTYRTIFGILILHTHSSFLHKVHFNLSSFRIM